MAVLVLVMKQIMSGLLIPKLGFTVILAMMVFINASLLAWGSNSNSSDHDDLTNGFESLPLKDHNFRIQRPYDVPENERYSFVDGVHKCWVYSTDKPHTPTSKTLPRTEISIHGYAYTSGVWQFEAEAYVPNGTSGVCIMQVWGATPPRASTLMVRVYNGTLTYYKREVLEENIYDRWFRLNVIHDADASTLHVYVDGRLKLVTAGRGGVSHNFKCGVYAQSNDSSCMESRWKNIKVLKKV